MVLAVLNLLVSLPVALPSAAADQDPEPAQLGDRVRVTCPALSSRPVIGTLVMTSEHELVVQQADGPVSLRRDAVVALEKSLGRRPRRSTRIAGAILGGLLTGTVAAATCCAYACALNDYGCNPPPAPTFLLVWSMAFGAATGYGTGSLFKQERWQPAGRTALAVEAAPTRGGARVSFSLRF